MADDGFVHEQHHDPTNYGMVSAPHGPETGDAAVSYPVDHNPTPGELQSMMFPDDIYTPEGVYWADLPFTKRVGFVSRVDHEEAKKELGQIAQMMKKDPLSPIGWYFRNAVLPGAGLGLEG